MLNQPHKKQQNMKKTTAILLFSAVYNVMRQYILILICFYRRQC